jgi:Skp family chaperone for outer membrane proteins
MIAALIILITFSYSVFALVPEGSSWKFKSATIAMILIFMFVIYLPVTKIFSIGSADLNKAYRVSKKRKAELEAIMQELDAGETRLQEVADELSVLEKTGFSELDRLLSEKKATVGDIYAGLQIEKKASETRKTFEQSMLKLNDFRQRTQAMLDGKRTEQSIAAFQAELDATTFS